MRKIVLSLILMMTCAFSDVKHVWATENFVEKDIKIIDIRTNPEWIETGIVKGSYTITFFDQYGRFDIPKFLEELNKVVKKDEQFALICRVGSRTERISMFLSSRLGYNVINMKGGIVKMIKEGYETTPYNK